MVDPVPQKVEAALGALWQLSPPAPPDLFKAPAFFRLRQACEESYANTGWDQTLNFALLHAVKSLGLPCLQRGPSQAQGGAIPVAQAARELHRAFTLRCVSWTHLCPLNLASELPPMKFGSARFGSFSTEELQSFFDWPQLVRYYGSALPTIGELAQFQWLVVQQLVPAGRTPGARAVPLFEESVASWRTGIEPHASRLPAAVEGALFFLLLAPWEEFAEMPEIDWRSFTLPWVYSRCNDLFVQPALPDSARSLSWEPRWGIARDGMEEVWDAPVQLPLKDGVKEIAGMLGGVTWEQLQVALQSPLFETPVAHFFVRAFLADGIDEFLAHITMIEAALGLSDDYKTPRTGPHKEKGATRRVAARVTGLRGSKIDGETYQKLFNLRSSFLHGRPLQSIALNDRIGARRLARRVVCDLIVKALTLRAGISREQVLSGLLDEGAASL